MLVVSFRCDAVDVLGGEALERPRQRLGSCQLRQETVADAPCRAARKARRDHGVGLDRAHERRAIGPRCRALRSEEEARPELRACGPERQRGGETAAVEDPARSDHGGGHGVDDLRDQRERADERAVPVAREVERRPMSSGFCPLRDDEVDAAVDHANGLLHGRDHRADVNARLVCGRYERCRVSEREAQHRDALREHDVDLLRELRGGNDDVAGASGQAQFGAQPVENGLHGLDVAAGLRRGDQEVDTEGCCRAASDRGNGRDQKIRRNAAPGVDTETARGRDLGDEVGSGRPARHRRLDDRILQAEEPGQLRPQHAVGLYRAKASRRDEASGPPRRGGCAGDAARPDG